MKKIITAFIFCFLYGECFSQAGEWVWIKGDSIPNQPGNFGVQGVPSPTNNPPGLYEPCEWADQNGNLWMFGGLGGVARRNDLWKYSPTTNEWTWMKGSGLPNDQGNYGIQGVSSPTNLPPARGWGIPTWTDSQNNLWLFGGQTGGESNDLWKYNISTNEWTWMKGSSMTGQAGIYGTQGVPDPLNNPGSRHEVSSAWSDATDNLWFFGGYNSSQGKFNDLWRYDITSDQWTWMKGSSTFNQPGIYGVLGTEDPANVPGARMVYSRWQDNTGNFWLFGGGDFSATYNDLWRYNPATNNWTWMDGNNSANASGTYGTNCNGSVNNIPSGRFENRASGVDLSGNFWLFGGARHSNLDVVWNDLWMYCLTNEEWIWVSGDQGWNPNGFWGTAGVSSPANKPSGRGGTVAWNDTGNHLYFYGGYGDGAGYYNDLWKFTIDTACGMCPAPNSVQENNPSEADELLVFPNPANSSLTVSFQLSEQQNIELRVFNTLGKQIYFSKEEISKGKFEKEINVEKLSGGIYFLQLKAKEGLMSRKVVVQH